MNLQVFCDADMGEDSRYYLSVPWVQGGWQYACNGRICVRIPANGQPNTEGRKVPSAAELFGEKFRECSDTWPAFEHKATKCRECRGTGKKSVPCETCSGEGDHYCNGCGSMHECGTCDGKGAVPGEEDCIFCNGGRAVQTIAGIEDVYMECDKVSFGERLFDSWFLYLIENQFENLRYCPEGKKADPLCFTADGGVQGMLMPLSF
jgi:hypothetical protein